MGWKIQLIEQLKGSDNYHYEYANPNLLNFKWQLQQFNFQLQVQPLNNQSGKHAKSTIFDINNAQCICCIVWVTMSDNTIMQSRLLSAINWFTLKPCINLYKSLDYSVIKANDTTSPIAYKWPSAKCMW